MMTLMFGIAGGSIILILGAIGVAVLRRTEASATITQIVYEEGEKK